METSSMSGAGVRRWQGSGGRRVRLGSSMGVRRFSQGPRAMRRACARGRRASVARRSVCWLNGLRSVLDS
eukprot:11215870-Lingulodinium_polyedra.AAC.1